MFFFNTHDELQVFINNAIKTVQTTTL